MRTRTLIVIGAIGLGLSNVGVLTAQIVVRQQAPADRAVDFPLSEIEATLKEMEADEQPTVRLVEGGSYNVNIRRLHAAEAARAHPRTTKVYVVREGSATLVTGGQIVDGGGAPVDGEQLATVRGGTERAIRAGDLVFIPAGVPHGIRDTDGITYFNIRFDTKWV